MDDQQRTPQAPEPERKRPSRRHLRQDGWRNADVLRATALVIAVYLAARLFWMASPLFFVAFLGILFGLAVASGVDQLARFRIPRGLGAALIVIAFFGLLISFGAWMAPTIRAQATEIRHRLPDALERAEAWARSHQNGAIGMVVEGILDGDDGYRPPRDRYGAGSSYAGRADGFDSCRHVGGEKDRGHGHRDHRLDAARSPRLADGRRKTIPLPVSHVDLRGVRRDSHHHFPVDLHRGRSGAVSPRHHDALSARAGERAGEVLSAIAAVLRRWLITQLIAMATIGSVTTVVLLVLGVKAAFALGLLAGLFEFIPTVGPILSAVPAVAMGFLDSPEKAVIVAVAFFPIQFMENHLLIPLLMKGGVDVPPVLTILSQALMALLFGFLGRRRPLHERRPSPTRRRPLRKGRREGRRPESRSAATCPR